MHRKKPLQNDMGRVQGLLVRIKRYQLFSVAQAKEHQAGLSPPLSRCRISRIQFNWRWESMGELWEFKHGQKAAVSEGKEKGSDAKVVKSGEGWV